MSTDPSGRQHELAGGGYRAVVVEVGGGIRSLTHEDRDVRDVLDPYAEDATCDGAHGAPLIPWPNRLGEGRYVFDGAEHRAALTEPEKNNAIHGLLRWRSWGLVERAADRIVVGTRLYPMPGYPFTLDVTIDYRLGEDGLTVGTTATNAGAGACPYGCGQHPYLSPGPNPIDDCTLEFAGRTRILTSPDRQLPTGTEPVDGSQYDFAHGRRLGELRIDNAFTDLDRDADDRSWVRLHRPDGMTVQLWVDETYPIVELFTGDTLSADRRRRGLGVEPMTCPPNAFQSGDGVRRLEPGQSLRTEWGVQLVPTPIDRPIDRPTDSTADAGDRR